MELPAGDCDVPRGDRRADVVAVKERGREERSVGERETVRERGKRSKRFEGVKGMKDKAGSSDYSVFGQLHIDICQSYRFVP